jgi:hypothetical protein
MLRPCIVRRLTITSLLCVLTFLPGVCESSPIQIGLSDFGAGATTFSFGSSGTPTLAGLSFVGGQQLAPGDWGVGSAPAYNTYVFESAEITFAAPVQRVGFYFGGNTVNTVPLIIGLNGSTTGSFTLQTTGTNFNMPADGISNWIFFGFEDLAGITSLEFLRETTEGWTVGIGQLTFEQVAVPEPASFSLLAIGIAGLGARRWRQRRQA